MRDSYDIAVIGAGAAGLTAAIWAASTAPDAQVVALDGAARIGAKILISGGGRCNVTHHRVTAADFNGSRNTVARILRTFPVEATVRWFEELGVPLVREESGKLFPESNRAKSVVDGLLEACGADLATGARVESVRRDGEGFRIETADGDLRACHVILATGGRSVPKTGSDGSGYAMVRELGHSVTKLFPALVPLVIGPAFWTLELSGTSVDAEVRVVSSTGRRLHAVRGSLLFTHFGLSGPAALDISRHWIAARDADSGASITLSFLPDETFETLEELLLDTSRENPQATFSSVLRGAVPERLLERLAPRTPIRNLPREERRAAIRTFLELAIPVERDRGFDYAEVTAGGVPLTEIDPSTMRSRVCSGLYLCGEILDVDGRIGGFNFQWAWASGRLAGIAAAQAFLKP